MAQRAVLVALLLGCCLSCTYARFLVLQQEEPHKFPGLEGHTYYVVSEEAGHSPETVATIKTWQANDVVPAGGAWNGGMTFVRNPFSWIFQQLEAVEALQRAALSGLLTAQQQTSMSADEQMFVDEQTQSPEDMLRHVGCSRFKAAMQQYASQQSFGDFSSRNYASEQAVVEPATVDVESPTDDGFFEPMQLMNALQHSSSEERMMDLMDAQVDSMLGELAGAEKAQAVSEADKEIYNYYGYYLDDEANELGTELDEFYEDYYDNNRDDPILVDDDEDNQFADLSDTAASKLMQLLEDAYSLSYEAEPLEPVLDVDQTHDAAYGEAVVEYNDEDYLSESGYDAAATLADAVLAELESEYFGYDDDTAAYLEDDSYYGYYGDDEYWDEAEDNDSYYEPQVLDINDDLLTDQYVVVSPGSDSWLEQVELPLLMLQFQAEDEQFQVEDEQAQAALESLQDYGVPLELEYDMSYDSSTYAGEAYGGWQLVDGVGNINWSLLTLFLLVPATLGVVIGFAVSFLQLRGQMRRQDVFIPVLVERTGMKGEEQYTIVSPLLPQHMFGAKQVDVEVAADHVDPKLQSTDFSKALRK